MDTLLTRTHVKYDFIRVKIINQEKEEFEQEFPVSELEMVLKKVLCFIEVAQKVHESGLEGILDLVLDVYKEDFNSPILSAKIQGWIKQAGELIRPVFYGYRIEPLAENREALDLHGVLICENWNFNFSVVLHPETDMVMGIEM